MTIPQAQLAAGPLAVNIFAEFGLCASKAEARRLARQDGIYVNGDPIKEDRILGLADLRDGTIQLRVGKKRHLILRAE